MMANLLETLMLFNNQTDGKDRIFRLLQYGSRLCWWLIEKHKSDKNLIIKLKKLENTLSTARKLLKLGRSLDAFYGTLKSIHLPDLALRVTITMAKINAGLYLLADHMVWLNRVGLAEVNNDKWSKMANKFWLYSIVMLLTRDVYEIWRQIKVERVKCIEKSRRSRAGQEKSLRDSKDVQPSYYVLTALSMEQKGTILDTVKNACDLFIPMAGLNLANVSPGFIGLCGTLSSIISIFVIFNPTYSMIPR